MRWQTFLLGAVGLALLELFVSRQQNAQNVGGFIAGLGTFVDKFVSPAYPGLSAPASSQSATAAASAYVAPPSAAFAALPGAPAVSPTL